MSRYKKAIVNEYEFELIDGIKAVAKPTIEDFFEIQCILKDIGVKKEADLKRIRDLLVRVLWQACLVWKDNKPTNDLIESESDANIQNIDAYVAKNVLELWGELLVATEISDRKFANKIVEDYKEESKN
jgi:hypothetical protein